MKNFTNALNLFDLRQVQVPPPFFEYEDSEFAYNFDVAVAVNSWIEKNTKGRYYIGRVTDVDSANTVSSMLRIGFENPKEMSYFLLACPLLKFK